MALSAFRLVPYKLSFHYAVLSATGHETFQEKEGRIVIQSVISVCFHVSISSSMLLVVATLRKGVKRSGCLCYSGAKNNTTCKRGGGKVVCKWFNVLC